MSEQTKHTPRQPIDPKGVVEDARHIANRVLQSAPPTCDYRCSCDRRRARTLSIAVEILMDEKRALTAALALARGETQKAGTP